MIEAQVYRPTVKQGLIADTSPQVKTPYIERQGLPKWKTLLITASIAFLGYYYGRNHNLPPKKQLHRKAKNCMNHYYI